MDEFDGWEELSELDERDDEDANVPHETTEGRPRIGLCRSLARRMLKEHRVTGPPVPIEDIARRLGYEIRIEDLPAGVDGRMRRSASGKVIQLAKGQPHARRRFTVAHELGHNVLGHEHGSDKIHEREANSFAGFFLVPGEWLVKDLRALGRIEDLPERYGVSREALFIALQRSRLLGRLR